MQASVRLTQGLLMAADAGVLLTLPLVRPVKVSQRHHHRHQHHQHHHHSCWNRIINNVPLILRNNLLLVGPVIVKGSHHHHHHHSRHHRHHHLTNSLFHLILSRATKAWRSMTNTIPSDLLMSI